MSLAAPTAQFIEKLTASLAEGTFVRVILSNGPDAAGPQKILGRRVDLKGKPHLSFTLRHATRDVTKNFPVSAGTEWLQTQLAAGFSSALLGTTRRDWQLTLQKSGAARLVSHQPATTAAPDTTHDQPRQTLLDDSAQDWLHGLGVTDSAGKVRASMADKHRQIAHYLEILSHLAKDCGWGETSKAPGELVLADMGCGKGYLTFGAWHLFHRVWQQPMRVIGVETREDLVALTNKLAQQLKADRLEFISGTIDSAPLTRVDALIALHACNTATDDAIQRGVTLGAKLIVVAPCCHKELRPQLGKPAPFAPVLRHGVMEERLAEWLTDGLRALFLEWAGYRTKVFEFVASEHTPKNLMIAAIREHKPFTAENVRRQIEELKSLFGIKHHALDALLDLK